MDNSDQNRLCPRRPYKKYIELGTKFSIPRPTLLEQPNTYREYNEGKDNERTMDISTSYSSDADAENSNEFQNKIVNQSNNKCRVKTCKENVSDTDSDNNCFDSENKLKNKKKANNSASSSDNYDQLKKIINERIKKRRLTSYDAVNNDFIDDIEETLEKIMDFLEKIAISVDQNTASLKYVINELTDLLTSSQQLRSTKNYTENLSTSTTINAEQENILLSEGFDETEKIVDDAVLENASTSQTRAPFTKPPVYSDDFSCIRSYQEKTNQNINQHQEHLAQDSLTDPLMYKVIGSEKIPICLYNKIVCRYEKEFKKAVKKLCVLYFGMEYLSTHSWSGKKSNAFANKKPKILLDRSKVYELQNFMFLTPPFREHFDIKMFEKGVQEACWSAGKKKGITECFK